MKTYFMSPLFSSVCPKPLLRRCPLRGPEQGACSERWASKKSQEVNKCKLEGKPGESFPDFLPNLYLFTSLAIFFIFIGFCPRQNSQLPAVRGCTPRWCMYTRGSR